jgi:hypothetical protein
MAQGYPIVARKYPEELLERGTRLVFESGKPIEDVPVCPWKPGSLPALHASTAVDAHFSGDRKRTQLTCSPPRAQTKRRP